MADSILETTAIRVVVDDAGLQQALQGAVQRARQATQQAGTAASAQIPAWTALRQQVFNLRDAYEADTISGQDLIASLKQVKTQALAAAESMTAEARATKEGAAAYTTYMRAAGSAARYTATAEGRISKLGLSANIATAGMRGLTNSMYYMGPAGAAMGGIVGTFGSGFETMGAAAVGATAAVAGVGLAAYALTRTGIPQVKEMQQGLQLLAATGNVESMQALTAQLDAAAAAAGKAGTQFSRGDLATGMARLVKAGMNLNDALKVLPPSMELAVESQQTLEEASLNLLTNLRQSGIAMSDVATAAGALGIASLRAKDNAQGLSQGLATVGTIAHQSGFSFNEILGALVTLSNVGLPAAQQGARTLRMDITRLLNPTPKAASALQQLGVATVDLAGHQRNVAAIMQDVIVAAHKMGVSFDQSTGAVTGNLDAMKLLGQIFPSRSVVAVAALASQVDSLTNSWAANTKGIAAGNDSLQQYADTLLSNNLAAAQTNLGTSFKNFAETMTVNFSPAMITAANALSKLLDQMDRAAQEKGALGGLGAALYSAENSIGRAVLTPILGKGAVDYLTTPRSRLDTSKPAPPGAVTYGPPTQPQYQAAQAALAKVAQDKVLAFNQMVTAAEPIVEAYTNAMKGTSIDAMRRAADALGKWESTGNKAEQALRKTIVSYIERSLANATESVSKQLGAAAAAQLKATQAAITAGLVGQVNLSKAQEQAYEQAQGLFPWRTIPMPAATAQVLPGVRPIPIPQATGLELPGVRPISVPNATVQVAKWRMIPYPDATATVLPGIRPIPVPDASVSVGKWRMIPFPNSTAVVLPGIRKLPIPEATVSVSSFRLIPAPNATATVLPGIRPIPIPEAGVTITPSAGARALPVPNAMATVLPGVRPIPVPNSSATILGTPVTTSSQAQLDAYANQIFGLGTQMTQAQATAAKTAAQLQQAAAQKFAQTVIQAAQGFEAGIVDFSKGNIGGGIAGVTGAVGGIFQGIPGLGLVGDIIGGVGSLFGGLIDAITGNTQATQQNTAALLQNVPTGFKVAQYAYNAAQPANITIQNVNITGGDSKSILQQLKKELARENYTRTGSTVGSGLFSGGSL